MSFFQNGYLSGLEFEQCVKGFIELLGVFFRKLAELDFGHNGRSDGPLADRTGAQARAKLADGAAAWRENVALCTRVSASFAQVSDLLDYECSAEGDVQVCDLSYHYVHCVLGGEEVDGVSVDALAGILQDGSKACALVREYVSLLREGVRGGVYAGLFRACLLDFRGYRFLVELLQPSVQASLDERDALIYERAQFAALRFRGHALSE